MEQHQTLEIQSKAKAFFQAKWFPTAAASLALVISIGGHAFTAFNSVGYVTSANKIESLEAFQATTQQVDGGQDRALQALNAELGKAVRSVQSLQTEIAELRQAQIAAKPEPKPTQARLDAVNQEALQHARQAKNEQRLHTIGVNERFDNLVRTRMQQFFVVPPHQPGAESLESDDVVVLQFAVDRTGLLTAVQVAISSGQIEFDNSAVKAALRMSAIPEIGRLNDQVYAQIKVFRLAITPSQMNPQTDTNHST